MRFARELWLHGRAYRQGGRKGSLPPKVGRSGKLGAIGARAGKLATRLDSVTSDRGESPRPEWGADTDPFPILPFASCFAYLPHGAGPICDEGRLLCTRLKAARYDWLPHLVSRAWEESVGHGRFAAALGARVVLVPVPGSAPLRGAGWVGERLAWCLKEVGLAAEVWPILRRVHAVRKSAFAAANDRPSVLEHYASFMVIGGCGLATASGGSGLQLTLVDDVITRGRTLLAAARRLRDAFPKAEIHAFALLRTLGPHEVLRQLVEPCEGEVLWASGDARRRP